MNAIEVVREMPPRLRLEKMRAARHVPFDIFDPFDTGLGCGINSGGAPAFSPLNLSPLGWWSASSVTQSGNRVTAVADLSGHGHNASLSGAYQPLYTAADATLNNMPSVRNDQTAAATGGGFATTLAITAPVTIYWMGYATTGGTNQTGPDIFAINGSLGRLFAGGVSSTLRINGAGNGINIASAFTTKCILCATIDANGNRCDAWLNSATTSAGNVTATATASGTAFGFISAQATNNNGGAFGDVIVYSGIHNSTQRGQVMGWGASKYGVTLT